MSNLVKVFKKIFLLLDLCMIQYIEIIMKNIQSMILYFLLFCGKCMHSLENLYVLK